ncbi:MAG TPA: hypothetical protein VIF62_29920, partial [Labilithrix sp.]
MRFSRGLGLAFATFFGLAAWITACGGSDGSSSDLVEPDASAEAQPPPPPPSAADSGADSAPPATCDAKTTTACAPRKCDPNLGCVQCAIDTDCTAAGADPFCILGRCEACRTNADCGVAAPACFPADHRCHRSCTGDAAVTCPNDLPICDATTGACVGCKTNTDCPATAPICEPATKTCGECAASSDCPAAKPRCDLTAFVCVQCVTSVDCPAGQACNAAGRCVVACTSDTQCSTPTPKCNTTVGSCVECLANPDCTNASTSKCDPLRDRCVQCLVNADCDADAATPFCADANGQKNVCVQCKKDQD